MGVRHGIGNFLRVGGVYFRGGSGVVLRLFELIEGRGVAFVALFWVGGFPALRGSFAGAKGRCGLGWYRFGPSGLFSSLPHTR